MREMKHENDMRDWFGEFSKEELTPYEESKSAYFEVGKRVADILQNTGTILLALGIFEMFH